jgi:hypothetical protein
VNTFAPNMSERPPGEYSLSAVVGAVVGSIGGLFAVGLPQAILGGKIALLFATPILALFSFFISGAVGWLLGGAIGPRLGNRYRSLSAEIFGGMFGGLIPVVLIMAWAWYMLLH